MQVQDTDKVSNLPSGRVPISDIRFFTRDISLSAALCPLGFDLKIDRQPIAITIDAGTERRIVDFFHNDGSNHPGLEGISARDVDQWWRAPFGKYTIEGFDDAIESMRKVSREREAMISVSKDPKPFKSNHALVDTDSLHKASIMGACSIPLIGYESRTRRWTFGKGAEVIYEMIIAGGKPLTPRPIINDLCIDWMLAWLKYHDWLKQLVKHPDCIPIVEFREGQKILQISRDMNEADRNRWKSYL